MRTVLFCLLVFSCLRVHAQVITTFAGSASVGKAGNGGQATAASLLTPSGVAVDRKGNVFFSDQNAGMIKKVDRFGIITTVAGNGTNGYIGDGGAATAAEIYWPTGVAVDMAGNVFIADQFNNVVRKVDVSGTISTLAGNGTIGFSGDGGPATDCTFWHPNDVGVDVAGNVYVADRDNHMIRKINVDGTIVSIAGAHAPGYTGDGGPATTATLNFPSGICVDKNGNVYVGDLYNNCIRRVDAVTGIITTVAGNGTIGYSADGMPATAAQLNRVSALAADTLGNIYFADYNNYLVRQVDTAGILHTIAGNTTSGYSGDGGPATAASIATIEGVAVDTLGNVYIADFTNHRVREIRSRLLSLVAGAAVLPPERMYPNPCAGGFVFLDYPGGEGSVQVISVDGAAVKEYGLEGGMNRLDVSQLIPGMYQLLIQGSDKPYSAKLVIAR